MQLPSDGNQRTEAEAKTESPNVVDNGWQNERAPKDGHAVSGMTPAKMAKVKANVIDHVLVLHSNDHKAKTIKMGQVQQKETS